MMKGKCRLWWPKQLLSYDPNSNLLLIGWFFRSSFTSVDVVVATAVPFDHIQFDPQEIVHCTHEKMPTFLQDHSKFAILGHYASAGAAACGTYLDGQNDATVSGNFNTRVESVGVEDVASTKTSFYGSTYLQQNGEYGQPAFSKNCRCDGAHQKFNELLEPQRHTSIRTGNWIHLISNSPGFFGKEISGFPRLGHINLDGQQWSSCDVHVIIYEQPSFGGHHFSLCYWNSSEIAEITFKRPKWVDELQQMQQFSDLESVFLALNSAKAAKIFCEGCLVCKNSSQCSPVFMLANIMWNMFAMFVASFFTLLYAILQFCHIFLSYGSKLFIYKKVADLLSQTWENVHIRCCQLLYCPIVLQHGSFRSGSSVEHAHRAALHKHSIWASVAVDVLLGNIVGWALLIHAEAVYFWLVCLAHDITNDLLRSGCVWLMGVPAGFKLNMELARVIGMVSLNAIQIWSTLWFSIGSLFRYFIEGLALSGIILGVTIPAALCIDMLRLATLHLLALHWLISVLYFQQIQALASLWRLFRGRKWNPLRQRLDSYNYTVGQHVLGSLLFTPLLLLLPTTSVFYIFFTIMNASISFVCILIEVTISILHATPYAEIFLWLVKPRRFPSGIWFEVITSQHSSKHSPRISNEGYPASDSQKKRKTDHGSHAGHGTLVSFLCSNVATIGQIVLPHYRKVFHEVSLSSGASSAHGVLSGRSIPSSLGTGLPSKYPWIYISFLDYWRLCCDSVLACR